MTTTSEPREWPGPAPMPAGWPGVSVTRLPDIADDGKALFEMAERPQPPRPPVRKSVAAEGKPPEHTAVYRLYAADEALLYVGMSNAPLERFIEHRDDKAWWPQVETYSIAWFLSRDDAEDAETAAIKDEWPVHNIAHQPRGNGAFVVPSFLVERLVADLIDAVTHSIYGVTGEQLDQVQAIFRTSFDPEVFPSREIWFAESEAPNWRQRQNVDEVIKALGSFRPPIASSMRVALPVEACAVSASTSPSAEVDEVPADLIQAEIARRRVDLPNRAANSRAVKAAKGAVFNHPWLKARGADNREREAALEALRVATDEWIAADDAADHPF